MVLFGPKRGWGTGQGHRASCMIMLDGTKPSVAAACTTPPMRLSQVCQIASQLVCLALLPCSSSQRTSGTTPSCATMAPHSSSASLKTRPVAGRPRSCSLMAKLDMPASRLAFTGRHVQRSSCAVLASAAHGSLPLLLQWARTAKHKGFKDATAAPHHLHQRAP